jgi:hypothetical protein
MLTNTFQDGSFYKYSMSKVYKSYILNYLLLLIDSSVDKELPKQWKFKGKILNFMIMN